MKLYTNVCDTTENIFENIIKEIELQRGDESLRYKYIIEGKIKVFLKLNGVIPDLLQLGLKEFNYFPVNFKFVNGKDLHFIETILISYDNAILPVLKSNLVNKKGQKI